MGDALQFISPSKMVSYKRIAPPLILLLALLLPAVGWSCDNCPTTMPRKNLEWIYDGNSFSRKFIPRLRTSDGNAVYDGETVHSRKPQGVSIDEISRFASLASTKNKSSQSYDEVIIAKWETPLRVRILDASGDDLPEDHYQRKAIVTYLAELSKDIEFPIGVTTRDKQDNNVSLIIGMLPRDLSKEKRVVDARHELTVPPFVVDDSFGAIMGVPSMNQEQKNLANAWLGRAGKLGRWNSNMMFDAAAGFYHPMQKFYSVYSVNSEIQSCVMLFGRSQIDANDVNSILTDLGSWMPKCLGLDNMSAANYYPDLGQWTHLKDIMNRHKTYILKLLYKNTKAGMTAASAQKAIHKYLEQN